MKRRYINSNSNSFGYQIIRDILKLIFKLDYKDKL